MGGAGGGKAVAGGTGRVARAERSEIRDSLRALPAPGCAALHPGYEPPRRMAARMKFPLAESPERSYTAKIALKASFP